MVQQTFMRWIKGLIPTVMILLGVFLLGCVCYLSIWGAPSFMVQRLEHSLQEQGIPVKLDTVKISLWPRAIVTLKNTELLDPEVFPKDYRTVAVLNEVDVALNWKKLMDGQLVPEMVNVRGLNVALPVHAEKTFTIKDLNAELNLGRPGMMNLENAEAIVQGIRVSAQGAFPFEQGDSDDPLLSAEEMGILKERLRQILNYLERVKWPKDSPPHIVVNLSDDSKGGVRVGVDMQAAELAYGKIKIRDFLFSGDYADEVMIAKRFAMMDEKTGGVVNLSLQADLNKREVIWDVRSTAPLVSWAVSVADEDLLPREFKFLSEPFVQVAGRALFDRDWSTLEHLNMLGSGSLGGFSVFGEKFRRASCDFCYENGNFYVTDLDIQHPGGCLTGKVMGVNGELKVDVFSTLPLKAMLDMARSIVADDVALPSTLEIRGTPEISVIGSVVFSKDWKDFIRMNKLRIDSSVSDVSYQGVDFESVSAKGELIGRSINISDLVLVRKDGRVKVEGSYLGTDLIFTVESDLKPELLVALAKNTISIPENLTLPEKADLRVHGRLDIPEGKPVTPNLIRVRLNAENLAWNKVPIKMADVEAEYRSNRLFVPNCRIEMENGIFELFANGFLNGQMFVMGRSTVPLETIDHLLKLEDDDFFMNRFVFRKESGLELAFQGTLGLYNLEKAYDLQATILATNTQYKGVDLKLARADAHLVTDQLVLRNVEMVVSNGNYLSSSKRSGGSAECTLKAESIDFRFIQDTVEVLGLDGYAYPGYTMQMFSESATRVLKDFVFSKPVKLSGGGVFPMGDDMKLMKGRIRFDASAGRVRYPLLDTILDLGKTKGEILISPQWVVVDKMQGTIWEGNFTGRVLARIDEGDALNGSFVFQDMNLTAIGESYDRKMEKAAVHGAIEFSSRGGRMNTIQAKGEAALVHGDLVEIPLFGFLGEALSEYIPGLGHLINYKLNRADCDFSIEKGYIQTNNFAAQGGNMSLEGGGWIRLSDLQVNANFKLGLRGLPKLITSPVFWLAGGLFQVRGEGPLSNVSWSFAPFSGSQSPVPPVAPSEKR